MKLDPRASAAGVRVVAHAVLGSTNTEALRLANEGERGPLWVTAERQTAGRGRRGRTWVSQPGNLHASLLLTEPAPAGCWPQLSFVAALAIHDAVVEMAAELKPRLAIKWPNDLLRDGAKFAGILVEGQASGGAGNAVAVGIGVNCASHPADMDYPATDLAEAAISPDDLFGALSLTMLTRVAQWRAGEGFAAIRGDWLARAAGLGEDVHVRLPDREIAGRFEALDQAGGLRLRLPNGAVTTVAAGDVLLRTAAPAETTR